MPDRARVDAFLEAVVHGDHAEAIADFYHDDATMQENLAPPRVGRDALVAHEKAALARMKHMETLAPKAVLLDGDHVVINWVFIMTGPDGVRRQLEEISLQQWQGDRIATERFFYDSKTAWGPPTD
jgi:ketosteroid isomerase-like protein